MTEDLELLIAKVTAMRKYQKSWYRYKMTKDLAKAKSLEGQVDELLKRMPLPGEISYSQKGMFQDDETRF